MDNLQIITDHGTPLLIASAIFAAIKALRLPVIQGVLAMLSPGLTWARWPKPVCASFVFVAAGAGALVTEMMQGSPLIKALPVGIISGLSAMGLDASHGAIKEPASAISAEAASIKIPIPEVKP